MKKKLLTLLTLLVAVCSGAWADNETLKTSAGSGTSYSISDTYHRGSGNSIGNNTYSPTAKIKPNSNATLGGVQCTNAVLITVNGGYKITGMEIAARSNYDQPANITNVYIDNTSNDVLDEAIEIEGKNGTAVYKNLTGFEATSGIVLQFAQVGETSLPTQINFYIKFTYEEVAGVTATPTITQSGKEITLACATSGASIYYTMDGTTPTTSSTLYDNTPFVIDNSCSIRAFATKNDIDSDITKQDCYVTHADALAVLGYNGGTLNSDENVWTSNDGLFTLTDEVSGRTIGYVNLAGTQDGFKLNHTDYYTIQPSSEIKITKIVVVGRSWLAGNAGNAATIAFDGFEPDNGTFFDNVTGGETYIKTIGFTPSSELSFGDAVIMRPGNNQLGAYIEIYGVKRSGPAEPIDAGSVVTWDFTNLTAQDFTSNKSYSFTATNGTTEMRYTAGSSDAIVAKDGNKDGYLKENGTTSSASCKDVDGNTAIGKTRLIRLFVTGKGKLTINCTSNNGVYKVFNSNSANTAADGTTALLDSYSANAQSGEITVTNGLWIQTTTKGYITSIVWTPSETGTILTTTANMAGWRTFYDADNSYTVDDNTTVYIAAANDATKVTLAEYAPNNIPAGTPVLLKTDAAAESDGTFKMTLAKSTSVAAFSGMNELKVSTAGQNLGTVYRLGFGEDGVGFYKYTTNSAAAGIVYVENVGSGNARSLMMVFDEESTGINEMQTVKNVENGKFYNLNGQQVVQPTKGMYIVNGKKYIIK